MMKTKNQNTLLASEKDREVFFKAMLNPPKPQDKLKAAVKRYKSVEK